jgi:hypothetical protein
VAATKHAGNTVSRSLCDTTRPEVKNLVHRQDDSPAAATYLQGLSGRPFTEALERSSLAMASKLADRQVRLASFEQCLRFMGR